MISTEEVYARRRERWRPPHSANPDIPAPNISVRISDAANGRKLMTVLYENPHDGNFILSEDDEGRLSCDNIVIASGAGKLRPGTGARQAYRELLKQR